MITLVIIGVIAAMTIPTLINKTNKQEYVSRLKKTYSTLSQATNRIIAEEGNPRGDIGGWATDVDSVYNLYKKHLQITKDCGSGSGCISDGAYEYPNKSGNTHNFNTNDRHRKFILSDGTSIIIASRTGISSDCSITGASTDACFLIYADINGKKGPKAVGRDMFEFVVKEDGLYPAGCDVEGYCTQDSSGWGCACKVIRENAMNY